MPHTTRSISCILFVSRKRFTVHANCYSSSQVFERIIWPNRAWDPVTYCRRVRPPLSRCSSFSVVTLYSFHCCIPSTSPSRRLLHRRVAKMSLLKSLTFNQFLHGLWSDCDIDQNTFMCVKLWFQSIFLWVCVRMHMQGSGTRNCVVFSVYILNNIIIIR